MATDFDAVVIGSGFGGAVAALRLAEGGYSVVVLERGRRWEREEYPSITRSDWLWDENHPERTNGWWISATMEISVPWRSGRGRRVASLRECSSTRSRISSKLAASGDQLSSARAYYRRVSDVLNPRKIPSNQFSNRTKLLREAALAAGFGAQYEELDLNIKFEDSYAYDASREPRVEDSVMKPNADGIDQGFCVHLGQCELGCPVEARNTLALNYIPRAEKKGAEVRPLHLVRKIEPFTFGYRVHFDRIENGKLIPGSVTARIVVVSGVR